MLAALALMALEPPLAAGVASAGGGPVPAFAHALEVTVRRPHRAPTSDVTVTSRSRTRRFASLINGLRTVRPGALDCTGKADDPVVTFTFRTAPAGRVVARASQIIASGAGRESCEPMTLTVNGRVRTPLLNGTSVVRAAQRLLGLTLPHD